MAEEKTQNEDTAKDGSSTDHPATTKAPEITDAEPAITANTPPVVTGKNKKSLFAFFKSKKGKITLAIIAGVILIVSILLAVPVTRYGILGTVIHKDLSVSVVDSKTGKPVSDATVSTNGVTAHTDNNGKTTLARLPAGQYQLSIQKKYYKDAALAVTVPILSNADAGQIKLEATGRQVPVAVVNKISGLPLAKVTLTAGDSTAITDAKGDAVLVVPANATTVNATLKASGYNDAKATITVTEQKDAKNTFAVVPTGKMYFLSKRTGIINVMKSDLDGNNAQNVVQGTGKEEDSDTVLLATKDWKYLLLKARRDSDKSKLYVINTTNDQLNEVDEGNADFTLVGWHNHTFVYSLVRLDLALWQPKRYAIKSYDADAAKLTTLDETNAIGSAAGGAAGEYFTKVFLIDAQNAVVYAKPWEGYATSKQATINSAQLDGSNKKNLKTLDAGGYLQNEVLYGTDEVYFSYLGSDGKTHFYEYDSGAVQDNTTLTDDAFNQFYPTYLQSPSGNQTFWYEPRDGKNTLFIGDKDGKNGKQIATISDYTPFGWYTDNYLLVSKGGSELYIVPAANPDFTKALKVTDYHKPTTIYRGYGGGYGGGF